MNSTGSEIPEDIREWIRSEIEKFSVLEAMAGFEIGAEAMYRRLQEDKPKGMRWVSVSERLPDIDENEGKCSKTVAVVINQEAYRAPAKHFGDPAGKFIKRTYHSAYLTHEGWEWEYGEHMDIESVGNLTHWLDESPDDLSALRSENERLKEERDHYRYYLKTIMEHQETMTSLSKGLEISYTGELAKRALNKYPNPTT